MKITETKLRKLTRKIISEFLTRKSGLSIANMLGGSGAEENYYGDGELEDYGDDFGDFGESDSKLEDDSERDE